MHCIKLVMLLKMELRDYSIMIKTIFKYSFKIHL